MKAHCSNPEMTGGEAISVPLIDEKVRMLEAIEVVGHHLCLLYTSDAADE